MVGVKLDFYNDLQTCQLHFSVKNLLIEFSTAPSNSGRRPSGNDILGLDRSFVEGTELFKW